MLGVAQEFPGVLDKPENVFNKTTDELLALLRRVGHPD
jgi:hypothetical protein